MKFPLRYLGVAFVLGIALSGCMVAKKPAPVVERAPEKIRPVAKPKAAPPVDQRPDTYVVKRGDTLYGIALDHGQDFRDIARWSNLADPNAIEVGQVLRVRDPAASKPLVAAAVPRRVGLLQPPTRRHRWSKAGRWARRRPHHCLNRGQPRPDRRMPRS
jgi:LysM repeat protein